jgi:hypothetical protein
MHLIRQWLTRLSGTNHARRPARLQPQLEGLEERLQPSATSVITSNFNGTAIRPGSSLWFNSVAKVSGLGSQPVELDVVNASIDFTAGGTSYHLAVPNSSLTFVPGATSASTTFDVATNTWKTSLPMSGPGNVFLSGLTLACPNGLPGGINPVTWTATFQSNTPGLSVNWQWGTAVYTSFSSDYNALNVKPVDSNNQSVYQNSDHAGTPEAFRACVVGGARGGGGSNWTGSYSATGHITPDVVQSQPPTSSISGVVYADNNSSGTFDTGDSGLGSVTVTLTGYDVNGNPVSLTTSTHPDGTYSFSGLQAGTYTVTVGDVPLYNPSTDNLGNLSGTDNTGGQMTVTVAPGQNGTGYNFGEMFFGV